MSVTAQQLDNMPATRNVRTPGRPSTYTKHILRKAKEYLKSDDHKIPTIAGLCVYLNTPRSTLYQWLSNKVDKELIDTISMMSEVRESRLIEGGLASKWNSNIVKLILTTNHGYSENNQKDSGITVNVNRSAAITHEDNTLTIDVED